MKRLLPLLLLAGCSAPTSSPEPPVTAAPAHMVKVMSVACDPNYGRPRIDAAFQNIGQTTIEWPKAIVSFGTEVTDTHLSTRPLRPGGIATATAYGNKGASADCSVLSVQDSEGFAATLSR